MKNILPKNTKLIEVLTNNMLLIVELTNESSLVLMSIDIYTKIIVVNN